MIWSRWKDFDKTWVADGEVADYRRLCPEPRERRGLGDPDEANLTGGGEPIRVGVERRDGQHVRDARVAARSWAATFTEAEDRPGGAARRRPRVRPLAEPLRRRPRRPRPRRSSSTASPGASSASCRAASRCPTDFTVDAAEPTQVCGSRADSTRRSSSHGNHGYYAAATLARGATAQRAHGGARRALTANRTREGIYPERDAVRGVRGSRRGGDPGGRAPGAPARLRRGRVPAADGVRQRRQPAARPRRGAPARDLGARRRSARARRG